MLLSGALGLGMAIIAEGRRPRDRHAGLEPSTSTRRRRPTPCSIEVTAQQFMWNVRYPGRDGQFGRTDPTLIDDTTNPLGLDRTRSGRQGRHRRRSTRSRCRSDRAVRIRLHSKDVIHSFFLPNFRVKQDAVPGMTPEVVFVPTRTGNFELACAELCGLAHYRMRGFFNVVSQPEFDEWLREQQEQP